MCGICFIIYTGQQTSNDELTLNQLMQYNNSFNDETPDKSSPEMSCKTQDEKYIKLEGNRI